MSFSEELGFYYINGSPEDMRERLSKACGAYLEYKAIADKLVVLADDFDDVMEDYDPVTWLIGLQTYTGHNTPDKRTDPAIDHAAIALRAAGDRFSELTDVTLKRCKQALAEIIAMESELQYVTIGFDVERDGDEEAFIDYLFSCIDDTLERLEDTDEGIELTYEPLRLICENDGIAIVLQCLYDIKDSELPPKKEKPEPGEFIEHDVVGQISTAMESFIEMHKNQVPCICPECRSTWQAEMDDLIMGTVLCPGCDTPMIPVNRPIE